MNKENFDSSICNLKIFHCSSMSLIFVACFGSKCKEEACAIVE